MLRASCLTLEFRYYEAKIEETEKAGYYHPVESGYVVYVRSQCDDQILFTVSRLLNDQHAQSILPHGGV